MRVEKAIVLMRDDSLFLIVVYFQTWPALPRRGLKTPNFPNEDQNRDSRAVSRQGSDQAANWLLDRRFWEKSKDK